MNYTNEPVACSFFALAYKLQVKNLPDGMSALRFTLPPSRMGESVG